MSHSPLIAGFGSQSPLGLQGGRTLAAGAFIAAATDLSQRLPGGGCGLLLCDDRLAFAVGFAAMALRAATALLPPSRAAHALDRITRAQQPSYALVDRENANLELPQIVVDPWVAAASRSDVTSIADDHVAALVYTSGTTGDPQPYAKTWSSLVGGAHALGRRIGYRAGDAIVGAVPPQHMWGLEATVMLPLQFGGVVHSGLPLLPDDIAAALSLANERRWLVLTPLHIRSCLASGVQLPAIVGVLTAASPLDRDVAERFEHATGAPTIEIYGATEAGVIATRHPSRDTAFVPLDGLSVEARSDGLVVRGARLPGDVLVRDHAVIAGDGSFTLVGRDADLVKIGGKRASLSSLNQQLLAIEGVVDGAFVPLPTGGLTPRLAALVVAPTLGAERIVAALRERVDAVFLPRPLHRVASLPRDPLGKLPLARLREHVVALSSGSSTAIIRHFSVPASHPALPGHFPGRPIVPAAWLLTLVAAACRDAFGDHPMKLQNARFRAPLAPGATVRVQLDRRDDGRILFACSSDATRVADGVMAGR